MGSCNIFHRTLLAASFLWLAQSGARAGCRNCAQVPLGGPADNPLTAYDAVSGGAAPAPAGYPRISVNLANLSLYVGVTDLAFGGPAPGFSLDRAFNMDNGAAGPFGAGWSFTLGDSLTVNADGSILLNRASGRTDRFAASDEGLVPITATSDTLVANFDGTYTLATPGSPTTRVFSPTGQLLAIRDSGASRVTLKYDSAGHISTAQYRGSTITFAYDSAGHIVTAGDSAGRTAAYSYSGNQLAGTANADGSAVSYGYDGSGNLVSIAYAQASFSIAYNSDTPYNSVSGITTPDGATRQYGTPQTPEQIQLTDGNGDEWIYASTAQGLLQSVTDGNGSTVSYTYNAAGQRTSVTNGAGQTSSFTYDANGNLTQLSHFDGFDRANPFKISERYPKVFTTEREDRRPILTGFEKLLSAAAVGREV